MFDQEKLDVLLADYKEYFPVRWKDEKYKWEAIRHFQRYWDIDTAKFSDMFMKAIGKTHNLLANRNNYPGRMMHFFAEKDAGSVKKMFVDLFDESQGLVERIERFQAAAEELRKKCGGSNNKQHYQTPNAITTYLWLKYPEKYYIYKYSEAREFALNVGSSFVPEKGRLAMAFSVEGSMRFYDEIREVVFKDSELNLLLENALDDNCYEDPQKITLTMDIGFFAGRIYQNGAGEPGRRAFMKKKRAVVERTESPKKDGESFVDYDKLQSNARFKKWLNPVIVALRELNGSANVQDVHDKIIELYDISEEELGTLNQSGVPAVINDIDWARNYLNYEGFLDNNSARGIWTLSRLGERIMISDRLAGMIISKWVKILAAKRENKPVPVIDLEKYYEYLQEEKVPNEPYDKNRFLSEVYMSQEQYDTLVLLLKNKKNLILQGAPGVGKTFAAKRLAYAMMGEKDDSKIEFIQFHQNYSYEDFIMGYKPYEEGFKLTNGIFYQFCMKAANHPEQKYFFIIDEINRGNMSKIFGELLMLIEKEYRGTKMTLTYSQTAFSVPGNLYVIGMMNTADRSLAMMDYALRRRFCFFEMEPGFASGGFRKYQEALKSEIFDALMEQIVRLNSEIEADDSLGSGFRIGHSYFCGQEKCTEEWLKSVVYYDIIPILQEYWFDDKQSVQRWKNNLSGVFHDKG